MSTTRVEGETPSLLFLRVLILEDNPRDAKLMASVLEGGGFGVQCEVTDLLEVFRESLEKGEYDVILADFNLRNWTAIDALEILKRSGKDIPLIVVTGTLGDEAAVECIKQGAADFVLKDRPARLPTAVQRALEEKRLREERKRAEEALRESEERFRLIAENVADLIAVLDLEGRRLYNSPSYKELIGEPDAMRGTLSFDEIHPDDREKIKQVFQETVRTGRGQRAEFRFLLPNGSVRFIESQGSTIRDEAGKPIRVLVVSRDVSERKRAEEAQRESERKYHELVEHANSIILHWKRDGRIISLNEFGQRFFGYTEAEICGRLVMGTIVPETESGGRDLPTLMDEVCANPAAFEQNVNENMRRNGERVWIAWTNKVVLDQQGKMAEILSIGVDITARKRAEEALREAAERARIVAESVTDLIYEWDLKDKVEWYGDVDRLMGYPTGGFPRTLDGWVAALHPEDKERVWLAIESQLKGAAVFNVEYRIAEKGGGWRWWSAHGTVLRDEQGQPRRWIGAISDITDRKRAEEALQNEKAFTESIIDSLPDIFYVLDSRGRYLRWNKNAEKILGYSSEELVALDALANIAGDDRPLVASKIQEAFAKGSATAEVHALTKDGRKIPYILKATRAVIGDKVYLVGIGVDITERKRAEAEHIRLVTAIEQSAEAVVITNTKGDIEYVNPAFTRITGYSRQEVLGQNPRVLKSGKQDLVFYQQLWATILKGEIWHGEVINRKKDGSLYTEEMNIAPVRGARGEVTHFIATKQDVTERKTLEAQLQQAAKMEAIGRLAGGVAHDFNNLLTIINGYAELLLDKFAADKQVGGQLKQIQDAGERAASLTRQLLAFSRRQVLAPQVLDLNAVVFNVEKMLRRLIGEDVKLRTSLDPLLGRVKADPGQIEQVIMNLAVNARDAMPSGGNLTIETSNVELDESYARSHVTVKPGSYVMLAVGDTGVGMTPETKTHIFEPFFTTKEKGKGTGLGLATVYGIVKQSEGSIWVYSELAQGTVFKVYLPTVSESPAAKGPAKTETDSVSGSETILVVEDEEGVRSLIHLALESAGYKVLEMQDAESALATCASYDGPIHLLLTDVVMPKMSGPLVAEKVTSLRPDIKVLYMSGYTDDAVVHHGVLSHDMPFIQKPFSPMVLRKKIREVLGGK